MPRGVYVRTEEHKKILGTALKLVRPSFGRKCPWTAERNKTNPPMLGKHHSEETKGKMSRAQKGHKGYPCWSKGLKRPEISGEKHFNWKGGVTTINEKIRKSLEYEEWRKAVFERDLYTCQFCGQIGGKLNADHIKKFADYPELRLSLNNGRTLCEPCHKKTSNYKNKRSLFVPYQIEMERILDQLLVTEREVKK